MNLSLHILAAAAAAAAAAEAVVKWHLQLQQQQ